MSTIERDAHVCTRLIVFALMLLGLGCGSNASRDDDATRRACDPEATQYLEFSASNRMPIELRLSVSDRIVALLATAEGDPRLAPQNVAQAETLYETGAELKSEVSRTLDAHFNPPTDVGIDIDRQITQQLTVAKTATTAITVTKARRAIEATLLRYFYLSAYDGLQAGTRDGWDDAVASFGAGFENIEAERRGIAALATSLELSYPMLSESAIFRGFLEGGCALRGALRATAQEPIALADTPPLETAIEAIDERLERVFGYAVTRDAIALREQQRDLRTAPTLAVRDGMDTSFAALLSHFRTIEPLMHARGGDARRRAQRIQDRLDAVRADATRSWMATFDAETVLSDVAAEYGIKLAGG